MDFTVSLLKKPAKLSDGGEGYCTVSFKIVGKPRCVLATERCSIKEIVERYKEELLKYDESEVSQTAKQI